MRYLMAMYLTIVAIVLVMKVISHARSGRVELFSVRNLFLAGFFIFQISSAVLGLGFFIFGDVQPTNFQTTPLIYAFMVSIFLWIFFWAYNREWGFLRRLRVPGPGWDGGPTAWLLLSVVMLAFGAGLKMGLIYIPLINIIASQMGGGVIAGAAACAGWGWAKNFRNVSVATIAIVVLGAACMLILYRAFGRRPVLGVLMAFGWSLYWGLWRAYPPGMLMRRLALWGGAAMFALVAYTASRSSANQFEKKGIAELLRAVIEVRGEDMQAGIAAVFSGQNAGPLSMWAIETYGKGYPHHPLHQVEYFFTMPIPRAIYPGKPEPLGKIIVDHGYIRLKGSGNVYNVGPGIIGHSAHDVPWIALPLYALLIGVFMRCIDEKTRWSLHLPVVVIPMGCALGQVMALARGEAALFVFEGIMAMIGAWIFIRFGARIVALFGGMVQTPPEDPWDPLLPPDEDDVLDEPHAATA